MKVRKYILKSQLSTNISAVDFGFIFKKLLHLFSSYMVAEVDDFGYIDTSLVAQR